VHGKVDPDNLQFAYKHYTRIKEKVKENNMSIQDIVVLRIQELFKDNPYRIFETKEFTKLMSII